MFFSDDMLQLEVKVMQCNAVKTRLLQFDRDVSLHAILFPATRCPHWLGGLLRFASKTLKSANSQIVWPTLPLLFATQCCELHILSRRSQPHDTSSIWEPFCSIEASFRFEHWHLCAAFVEKNEHVSFRLSVSALPAIFPVCPSFWRWRGEGKGDSNRCIIFFF